MCVADVQKVWACGERRKQELLTQVHTDSMEDIQIWKPMRAFTWCVEVARYSVAKKTKLEKSLIWRRRDFARYVVGNPDSARTITMSYVRHANASRRTTLLGGLG